MPHEGELSLMLSKHKKLLLARQMQEEIEQLAWFALHTRGNEIIDSMGRKNPTKHENMGVLCPNKILDKAPEWELEGEGSLFLLLCFSDGIMEL